MTRVCHVSFGSSWKYSAATHSSTLAWKIPWMEEPGSCTPWDLRESDTTEQLYFHFSLSCIREGNGNPLQCSCLKNLRDSRTWWAAVFGVTQSQTQLRWLSSSSSSSRPSEVNREGTLFGSQCHRVPVLLVVSAIFGMCVSDWIFKKDTVIGHT